MTDIPASGAPGRITLPRPPAPQPRQPFPVLASLAPVIGSLVIWAITSSPFALVFAFLGPVIAVGTLLDGRLHGRRRLAKERFSFESQLSLVAAAIDEARIAEGNERSRVHPGALALLAAPERDPERWRKSFAEPVQITLGWSNQASLLRVDGDDSTPELAGLVHRASTVCAPFIVDARLGIGIVGNPIAAWACARGLALQLANLLPPETAKWEAPASECEWLALLPHAGEGASGDVVRWSDSAGDAVISVAGRPTDLPHASRVVLSVGGPGGARLLAHPDLKAPTDLQVESVSIVQAEAVAARLAGRAVGRLALRVSLPFSIPLAAMAVPEGSGVLAASFLTGTRGAIPLDLVLHGPHAVVGGMTGSGKSELLLSWLLSMALHSSPEQVNFLLVDFKGGASFGPIVELPHVVGLVTDLNERSAYRALTSLRAEVRFREQRLAACFVRSMDDLPDGERLPRLVIVVDEFAALVGGFPDLHDLFADLAARGRSLGVHLVLCTQRPAGVIRDSVLANVPLRLSLRVNNRADSTAVIGSDAAASLPSSPPGRALVAFAGEDPVAVQVALAAEADIAAVVARWAGSAPQRRPWCEELPPIIRFGELNEAIPGLIIGLADHPAEQRRGTAAWNPVVDGNLLVLGGAGSGKSTLLALLAAQGAVRVPADIEGAWDVIESIVDSIRRGTVSPGVLLIDDIDALIGRFGGDHDLAFIDLLVELMRTGSAAGIALAVAARRLPAPLQSIAASSECRLLLRHPNRQDYQVSGGDPALFSAESPAGRAEWRGQSVQVAWAEPVQDDGVRRPPLFEPIRTTLVVSSRPGEFSTRYPACRTVELQSIFVPGLVDQQAITVGSAVQPTIVVGDADAWQANWALLLGLRSTSTMLFERSTIADFRIFTASRQLPPPLSQYSGSAWKVDPGRQPTRVRLTDSAAVRPARPPAGSVPSSALSQQVH